VTTGDTYRLLLVGDDPGSVVALERDIDGLGLVVIKAWSVAEAMRLLDREDVALLVVDVMRPEADAVELVRRTRALPRTEHLPVLVVLPPRQTVPPEFDGDETGLVDVLLGPVVPGAAKARLRFLLEFHRQRLVLADEILARRQAQREAHAAGTETHTYRTAAEQTAAELTALRTHARRLKARLQQATALAARAERARDGLVAALHDEVRPIVDGALATVEATDTGTAICELVALQLLLEDLVGAPVSWSGGPEGPVDLETLVHQACEVVVRRGLTTELVCDLDETTPFVLAPPTALRHMVIELVATAARRGDRNGVCLTTRTAGWDEERGRVVVEVAVSPAPPSTDVARTVRRWLGQQDGRISVDSDAARLSLSLPRVPRTAERPHVPRHLTGRRILVVDANPAAARATTRIVSALGLFCESAASAAEARASIVRRRPDVVLASTAFLGTGDESLGPWLRRELKNPPPLIPTGPDGPAEVEGPRLAKPLRRDAVLRALATVLPAVEKDF